MIIKFDHIAFTCNKSELKHVLNEFSQYSQVFYDKDLPNLENKRYLMDAWCNTHDIILLNSTNLYPVEITAYDHTCSGGKYNLNNNIISVNTASFEESALFYQAIGFKYDGDSMVQMKTIMDEKPVVLSLVKSETLGKNHLDSLGFCCLAFVSNDVRKERQKLEKKLISVTEIMTLSVNKQNLDIFFAYNNYGDICEFVSLTKEENNE